MFYIVVQHSGNPARAGVWQHPHHQRAQQTEEQVDVRAKDGWAQLQHAREGHEKGAGRGKASACCSLKKHLTVSRGRAGFWRLEFFRLNPDATAQAQLALQALLALLPVEVVLADGQCHRVALNDVRMI